ncbi:hypothetical protein [Bernardetia sp.]|uniref:hypothetical protein n=1 Tax=Bernardetia sp. TaxID=1937974 RepID=UPI0025C39E85|nr:hypothetical protein [Bernardetia sp.]
MQRTKLREIINNIVDNLQTIEIIDSLSYDSSENTVSYETLMALLLESKTGYDHLSEREKEILMETEIHEIYTTDIFVELISKVRHINDGLYTFLNSNITSSFLALHKTLALLLAITDEYLLPQKDIFNDEDKIDEQKAENNNILMLQLVKDENLTLDELSLRINLIKDLIDSIIEIVIRIYPTVTVEKPKILLLDSGSDAQVWIEIIASQLDKVNVVKYIANAFSTVWNHCINRDLHKAKKMSEIDKLEIQQLRDRLDIVKDMNNSGLFKKKEIEQLSSKIVEEVGKSIESGTITNELINKSANKPKTNRQLIAESDKPKELPVKSEKRELPPHSDEEKEQE